MTGIISQENFYKESDDLDITNAEKYSKALEWFKKIGAKRVLDIGCGDGTFILEIRKKLGTDEVFGIDISEKAIEKAKKRGVVAYKLNLDQEDLRFENDHFDGIFCGEVIEHVFDTDHLLSEIFRVLKNGGIAILTTPNLASWYNRILLLLGYQPIFTEVSLRYSTGHPYQFNFKPGGHLRIFTLKALVELVKIHKFETKSVIGFGINTNLGFGKKWKIITWPLNKSLGKFPSLSSNIMLIIEKPNPKEKHEK